MKARLILAAGLWLAASMAVAQTTPLKSFAYASSGCSSGLLTFSGTYQMTSVPAGAGQLPAGNFWIRAISLTFLSSLSAEWSIVGHSGSNGDWVTPPTLSNSTASIVYPADAAPLFTVGDYLDVHVLSCSYGENALVSVWYVPAP